MGYLTGKVTPSATFPAGDLRGMFPRFTPEALGANRPVVEPLEQVGRQKGATPGQVALAWLLAMKPWIVPIPGTTNPHHLNENLGAAAVKFTPDELREVRAAVSKIKVQGARAPESALSDQ